MSIASPAEGPRYELGVSVLADYERRTLERGGDADPGSLSHAFSWFLHEDARGRLWVGTHNGLNLFDETTRSFRRFMYGGGVSGGPSHGELRAVDEAANGELWFGTARGLNRLNAAGTQFAHYFTSHGLAHNRINAVAVVCGE